MSDDMDLVFDDMALAILSLTDEEAEALLDLSRDEFWEELYPTG